MSQKWGFFLLQKATGLSFLWRTKCFICNPRNFIKFLELHPRNFIISSLCKSAIIKKAFLFIPSAHILRTIPGPQMLSSCRNWELRRMTFPWQPLTYGMFFPLNPARFYPFNFPESNEELVLSQVLRYNDAGVYTVYTHTSYFVSFSRKEITMKKITDGKNRLSSSLFGYLLIVYQLFLMILWNLGFGGNICLRAGIFSSLSSPIHRQPDSNTKLFFLAPYFPQTHPSCP